MMNDKKAVPNIWFYLFLLIWCVQMFTAVYFCFQKQGFHEDEYYTFYSTARTYGLAIEEDAWMEHDAYLNEFVVLPGQRFQYGLVKLVQSWDVHPPFYYWVFHSVCSLFPGQFSKWFGLVINLAAFGVSMFLLRYLALLVTKHNEKLTLVSCLLYGFTPAAMSSVVFIRMYALLTVFVYLCAILHVSMIENYGRLSGGQLSHNLPFVKFLLPLAVVTYLGFLTQYYYFIFLFFMAFFFCIYLLWKDRNLWNCIRYGVSVGLAFILAYLTYPSCLGQMFRGQRGAQATENFFDWSNTWMRLVFFWKLLDEFVFGELLAVFLLILLFLLLFALIKGKIRIRRPMKAVAFLEKNRACFLLFFSVIGYFLAVSKTALLLGDTSVRYQTPIYGMVMLLILAAIEGMGRVMSGKGDKTDTGHDNNNFLFAAAVVVCLLMNLSGMFSGRVVFLYPEDAQRIAFAEEKAAQNTPVIYLYDVGQSWCVWDSADEFFAYDRIYFADREKEEPIADKTIAGSDDLMVYMSNAADVETQLQRILNSNLNVTAYELKWQDRYCFVYYFY